MESLRTEEDRPLERDCRGSGKVHKDHINEECMEQKEGEKRRNIPIMNGLL